MQLTISRDQLLSLISRCASVTDKRSTMPILSSVLLVANGKLECSASDLDRSVSGATSAEIKKTGSVALDARALVERVKSLTGNISITSDGSKVTLKSGSRRFTMHGVPGEQFPQLPKADDARQLLTMPAEKLARLIASVQFAVSTDETRLHLNSALFECDAGTLRMVATDGHRMSLVEAEAPDGAASFSVLVPLKGLTEIRRLLEEGGKVLLSQEGSFLFVDVGGFSFAAKTADSQFPPYGQVIPTASTIVASVPRGAFSDAVKAVLVAASDKGLVRLAFGRSALRVEIESPDTGDGLDEVAIECNGEVTIGANGRYLLDALGAAETENVTVSLNGELDPIVITPSNGDSAKFLIMPARL
jgi:DNA polymerase-3 subunit beta